MRVVVTGGTGLLGRHVIERLVGRGDVVSALARSDAAARDLDRAGARVLRGDLLDLVRTAGAEAAGIAPAVAGADAVVHAGAVVLSRRGWEFHRATNVEATLALARMAARTGARLVHLSSVAVYGRRTTYDGGPGSVTEGFGLAGPLFPGDHYARSKREAELGLWKLASETAISAVALRPCVVYGEGDRNFTNRVARWLSRGWAPVIGDGGNPLAVVYAGNVATAVLAALDRPDVKGAFNVTNDGAITQRAFLERFAAGLGVRLHAVRIPHSMAWTTAGAVDALTRLVRPSAPMTLLKTAVQFLSSPNPYLSDRAKNQLGWRPTLGPEEAVERTARWFRERGGAIPDAR